MLFDFMAIVNSNASSKYDTYIFITILKLFTQKHEIIAASYFNDYDKYYIKYEALHFIMYVTKILYATKSSV